MMDEEPLDVDSASTPGRQVLIGQLLSGVILAVLAAAIVFSATFHELFTTYWPVGLVGVLGLIGVVFVVGGLVATVRSGRRRRAERAD